MFQNMAYRPTVYKTFTTGPSKFNDGSRKLFCLGMRQASARHEIRQSRI